MKLKDIPNGSKIFIDANIFLTVALKRPKRYGIKLREVPDYVKRNPTCISQLSECWRALEAVMRLGVTVLAL